MIADEVLEALKSKISDFWYGILKGWLIRNNPHGTYKIFRQITSYGYNVINSCTDKGIAVFTDSDNI